MAIVIGRNISSLWVQRRLGEATSQLATSNERLSSGMRINRPSDDAASLSIASTLSAATRVYGQAIRNLNDGSSFLNVGQGALEQLRDITFRQKELAEQASNGVLNGKQRSALSLEAKALTDEFNRIVAATTFNGRQVFDVSSGNQGVRLQAGYGAEGSLVINTTAQIGASVGSGDYQVQSANDVNASSGASILTADFNNDGHLDILNENGLLLGTGTGSFTMGADPLLGPDPNEFVAAADINGDGIADFVTKNGAYVNNGHGVFSTASTFGGAALKFVGDINGDGKTDVIYDGVTRIGKGDGTFQAGVATTLNVTDVSDFNGDGVLDLIGTSAGQIAIARGVGNGLFAAPAAVASTTGNGGAVAGDFNHDGFADFASIVSGNSFNIFLGNGNQTFRAPVSYSSATNIGTTLNLRDVNGDGNKDIVYGSGQGDLFGQALGNSDGSFSSGTAFTSAFFSGSGSSVSMVFGDFNEDGALDTIMNLTDSGYDTNFLALGRTKTSANAQYLDFSTAGAARSALTTLDAQLRQVVGQLGGIGASQSRLSYDLATLQDRKLNFSKAESTLTDVDIASESSIRIRTQILQQTTTAVLAQANQAPALALKLLKRIS